MILFLMIEESQRLNQVRLNKLVGWLVGFVSQLRSGGPAPSVVVVLVVSTAVSTVAHWVCDHLVALVLRAQQFLQTQHSADDQGEFTGNQSLEGQQSEGTKNNWHQGSQFQFQQKKNWQQRFHDLFLFATS